MNDANNNLNINMNGVIGYFPEMLLNDEQIVGSTIDAVVDAPINEKISPSPLDGLSGLLQFIQIQIDS